MSRPARCHEDLAANTLAFILVVAALATLATSRACRRSAACLKLGAVLIVACLLFCAVLRWQPWHSRLHIPLFFFGLTLAAGVMALAWRPMLRVMVATIVILVAMRTAWHNETRPLAHPLQTLDRPLDERMFRAQRGLFADYRDSAAVIIRDHPRVLGLVFYRNEWEFPLWYYIDHVRPRIQICNFASVDPIRPAPKCTPIPDELLVDRKIGYRLPASYTKDFILIHTTPTFDIYRNVHWQGGTASNMTLPQTQRSSPMVCSLGQCRATEGNLAQAAPK